MTVLDAATGRTRWSLRDRMGAARMAAAAGGMLLVRKLRGGALDAPVLLDLATGAELGRASANTGNCADDHASLIACDVVGSENRLVTMRSDERRVRFAGQAPPDGAISLVADGRIYYSGGNTPGAEVDRSGTPLGRPLPEGYLTAISGEYAVFRFPESQRYEVYRVG
jgi:hypothetical protein